VFPPGENWFSDYEVQLDLGFYGFEKLYECKKLKMPHKKPKGKELTDEQKEENKGISSERVVVEHSIGGLKRYRILSDRLRMKNYDLYDDILEICAGLWNYAFVT
jgi:DDE superfamily endonuclease